MALTFNEVYYLSSNADVFFAVVSDQIESGLAHYNQWGWRESRDPHPDFDTSYYVASNPDVLAAVQAGAFASPLQHFQMYGAAEGRAPSAEAESLIAGFNEDAYLTANQDVADAIPEHFTNALQHFQLYGRYEDRDGAPGSGEVEGGTFTLSPATDVAGTTGAWNGDLPSDFRFTTADETVEGMSATTNDADVLLDASTTDNDVFNISLTGLAGAFTAQNIETINTNFVVGGAILRLDNVVGTSTVNVSGTAAGTVASFNAQYGAPRFILDSYTNTLTLAAATMGGTTAGGNAETIDVEVSGTSFGSTAATQSRLTIDSPDAGDLETLNITSAGNAANVLALDTTGTITGISAINIDGEQDVTVRLTHALISGNMVNAIGNDGDTTLSIDRDAAGSTATDLADVSGVESVAFRDSAIGGDSLEVTNVAPGTDVRVESTFGSGSISVLGASMNTADVLNLTLDNTAANTGTVIAGLRIVDIETLNLVSSGSGGATISTGNFVGFGLGGGLVGDFTAINISGDTSIRLYIDTLPGGDVITIDASGLTGAAAASIQAGDTDVAHQYVITGSGNADTLIGGWGNDTLNGGGGDDFIVRAEILATEGGIDTLSGGAGNDVFVMTDSMVTSTDPGDLAIITDFAAGAGAADVMRFYSTLGLGGGGYYEGPAAGLDATDYAFIVLTEAYADVGAAEDAVSAGSTSATEAIVLFFNSSTNVAEAFYDPNLNDDNGLGTPFAQFQTITTAGGMTNFDSLDFAIV